MHAPSAFHMSQHSLVCYVLQGVLLSARHDPTSALQPALITISTFVWYVIAYYYWYIIDIYYWDIYLVISCVQACSNLSDRGTFMRSMHYSVYYITTPTLDRENRPSATNVYVSWLFYTILLCNPIQYTWIYIANKPRTKREKTHRKHTE